MKEGLIAELRSVQEFFERSTNCLIEEDSAFTPCEGTLTIAQQVAHCGQTVEWFIDAIKNPEGFDMDFEGHWKDVMPCNSLQAARQRFAAAIESAISTINGMSEEELSAPLPEGPVMGGAPKHCIVGGISDHTAHHRGALTVYSRLLGKEPQMPYMD